MKNAILPAFVIAMLLCVPAIAAPPIDDIRQMVQAGQFPEALQKISASLAAPKAAHQYDLYMLKGECHLQTKAIVLAADSFDRAAKATEELEHKALALAHGALIKKSVSLVYKVRTGDQKGQVLEIVKPDMRKAAFTALLADELTLNKGKIKQAEGAKKLPPILDIVDDVVVMEGLELAAKGKADETHDILKTILARAKDLMSDSLKEMDKDVDRIDKSANTYREFTQDQMDNRLRTRKVTVWQKRGLDKAEMNHLQQIGHTCDQIGPAIKVLAQGIKSEQKELESLADHALKIRKQITQVLDEDYTKIYHQKPPK